MLHLRSQPGQRLGGDGHGDAAVAGQHRDALFADAQLHGQQRLVPQLNGKVVQGLLAVGGYANAGLGVQLKRLPVPGHVHIAQRQRPGDLTRRQRRSRLGDPARAGQHHGQADQYRDQIHAHASILLGPFKWSFFS